MATRKIVPRATGEGGVGKATKRWSAGYFLNIHLGDGVGNSNPYLYASVGLGDTPALRYNISGSKWEFSNDGLTFSEPWLKIDDVEAKNTENLLYKNQTINAASGTVVLAEASGWELVDGTFVFEDDISYGIALNVSEGVGDILYEGVYENADIDGIGAWYCDASGVLTQSETEFYVGYAFETGKLLLGVAIYTPAV